MPAANPSLPFAYEVLYERLRQEGFRLGVDHQLRVQELLSVRTMDAMHVGPANLKTLLCPLFATNRAQQETFYRVFDEVHADVAKLAPVKPGPVPVPERASGVWERMARPWIFALLFALAAGGLYWKLRPGPAPAIHVPIPPTPPPQTGPIQRERVFPIDPARLPHLRLPDESRAPRWTAVAAPLLAFGAFALFRAARRKACVDRQEGLKPPHYWPLKVEPPAKAIYPPAEVRQLASRMRRRQDGPEGLLDVPATIAETIRRAGFLRFMFRSSRRPPEYIALIERQSVTDHFTALMTELTRVLQADGVHLARYYYDHDPYRVTNDKGDDLLLPDLSGVTPFHRLLVFGPSGTFLHPVSGRVLDWAEPVLEKWPMRAMLVEDTPARRRVARLQGDTGLFVGPASLEGLRQAIEFFDSGGTGAGRPFPPFAPLEPPFPEDEPNASVAACAIYPELNWNLTRRLTKLDEAGLSRLSRMPWFRVGEMPGPVREDLIAALPEEDRPALQRELVSLIRSQMPPKDTFAWEDWQAVLRLCGPDPRSWWQRFRSPAPAPVQTAGHDFVFLRFLDWQPKSTFSFLMNEGVRGWLFESGLRSLGVRTVALLPMVALLSAGLAVGLQPWKTRSGPMPIHDIKGKVVNEKGEPVAGVQVDGMLSGPDGRFEHVNLPDTYDSIRVRTTHWPREVSIGPGGEVTVQVGLTRLTTGAINWFGIQQQGESVLFNFEGGFQSLRVRDQTGRDIKVLEAPDGYVISKAFPGSTYRVEIDGREYGQFTVPGGVEETKSKAPEIRSFTGKLGSPSPPILGVSTNTAELKWTITGAEQARLEWKGVKGIERRNIDPRGGSLSLPAQAAFTLVATNSTGSVRRNLVLGGKDEGPQVPEISSFTGREAPLEKGVAMKEILVLYWTVRGATRVQLTWGDGKSVQSMNLDPGAGSVTVPTQPLFTLIASNTAGSSRAEFRPPTEQPKPTVTRFEVTPAKIRVGESAKLVWAVSNAQGLTVDFGTAKRIYTTQERNIAGEQVVQPSQTTRYSLEGGGIPQREVELVVEERPITFTADPPQVSEGGPVKLSWSAPGATVSLVGPDGYAKRVTGNPGELVDTPARGGYYTLTATYPDGTRGQRTVAVRVLEAQQTNAPAPGQGVFARLNSIKCLGKTSGSFDKLKIESGKNYAPVLDSPFRCGDTINYYFSAEPGAPVTVSFQFGPASSPTSYQLNLTLDGTQSKVEVPFSRGNFDAVFVFEASAERMTDPKSGAQQRSIPRGAKKN